jgi:putative transposase
MRRVESLSHTRWECKYHIVLIPKYRRKTLFGQIRRELGEVFHQLARQKESLIEEGHIMGDHVLDTPEIRSISGSRVYQRKKCDLHCAYIPGTEAK